MADAMTAQVAPVHAGAVEMSDPEVPERAKRRGFSAEYKLRVLDEIDKAPPGEISPEVVDWARPVITRRPPDRNVLQALLSQIPHLRVPERQVRVR